MTRRWLMMGVLACGGCGATLEQLQNRAAVDLDCRPEAITGRELDGETTIASGCGKQAIYVETCTGRDRSNCTWMLNSPVRQVETAAAK